jgi:hypothetical protein
MIKGGLGGGNTKTGLIYEGKVDLPTYLANQEGYAVQGSSVFYKGALVAHVFKKRGLYAFLKENGISADEISVAPISVDDREADRWSNNTIPYRYQLKSVITVASDQVDKVRDLISRQDEFLSAGITCESSWEHQTSFSFNGLNELKPEMVEEATRNARAVAEKFAADSESTLGGIKTASQGQFSIYDRDENTPYIKMVRVVTTIEYFLK